MSSLPTNVAPAITSLNPSSISAGSGSVSLVISGSGFVPSSSFSFNGVARSVSFVNSAQVSMPLTPADLSVPGQVNIAVQTPPPGGGSAQASFLIESPKAPAVTSVSPASTAPGSSPVITVTGSSFVKASLVTWDGIPLATTYVSNSSVTAAVPASLSTAGVAQIAVSTPAPGGGVSSPAQVTVQYPIPTVTSVSPAAVELKTPQSIVVVGTDFYPNALVYVNSLSRVTTFISSTEVHADLVAGDVASPATLKVAVQNPPPTPAVSNTVDLAVGIPTAVVDSVSPSTWVAATSGRVPIQVKGSKFYFPQVIWNGQASPSLGVVWPTATVIDDNTVNVFIPPQLSATLGPATIQLQNSGSNTPSASQTINIVASGPGVQSEIIPSPVVNNNPLSIFSASNDLQFITTFDNNHEQVFSDIYKTCLAGPVGCTPQLVTTVGVNYQNQVAVLSDTGRYAVYWGSESGSNEHFVLYESCLTAAPGCSPSNLVLDDSPELQTSTPKVHTVPAVTNGGEYALIANQGSVAYLKQTCIGNATCTPEAIKVSVDTADADVIPDETEMTLDARYVLFHENSSSRTFVRDTCIGAASGCTPSTTLLKTWPFAVQLVGMSNDGRYAVLLATGSTPKTYPNTYVLDTCVGATGCTPNSIELTYSAANLPLSLSQGRLSYFDVARIAFSPNNDKIAFATTNPSLVANDTDETSDSFVMTTCLGVSSGCVRTIQRITVNAEGVQDFESDNFAPIVPVRFSNDGTKILLNNAKLVTVP